MKKRILFIASGLAVIAFILVSQYIPTNFYMNGFAESSKYSLVFNKDKNKFHNTSGVTPVSGTSTVKTELGSDIVYSYSNVIGGTSTWHVLSQSNSYFYNQDPLNGLYSIELSFKTDNKEFKIYWSSTLTFDEVNCETFTSSSGSNITCYFNGYNPNYVKVENLSGSYLNISNVFYKYSCTNQYYELKRSSEDELLGTVSGDSGVIKAGTEVTISATPSIGSHFVGWYDGDTLISSSATYKFTMPHNDINYVGKFEYTYYSLTVTSEDENKGTTRGSGNYIYQQEVEIEAIPLSGYTFFGWYIDDELLSRETKYNYTMPLYNVVIVAKFSKLYNLYIESDDVSKGTVSYPSTFGEGLEVTINAIPNEGCALNYWHNEDFEKVCYELDYTFVMPSNDVVLYANFIDGGYNVKVNYDTDLGLVYGDFNYLAGQTVTLSAIPLEENFFKGWYSDFEYNNLISKNSSYTFTMPSNNVELYAKFWTKAEEEWNIAHGVIPTFNSDKTKLTYGLYPQTHVNDSLLIESLNKLDDSYIDTKNGWYFYNDEYYAKTVANTEYSDYKFSDGTVIIKGNTYWFKCEPIEWNILSNSAGEYFVLSSVLLDVHRYDDSENNYMNSEIRQWLNNDFYDSAFALNNSYILTTKVDNSASTTDSSSNPYACESTFDKVFMPSYKDYINIKYGFSPLTGSSITRQCKVTDWAKANNAYTGSNGNGYYWTRSPHSSFSSDAWVVSNAGLLYYDYVNGSSNCVRPSLNITIAE